MSEAVLRRRRRKRPWIATTLAVVFVLVWIFPVYWMVNTAFKPRDEVLTPVPKFLPSRLNFDNFVIALTQTDFLLNLRNSVEVFSVGRLARSSSASWAPRPR